jgi:hypothetical protein
VRKAIASEFKKMRRLRVAPIALVLVVAVAALSGASTFSGSARETFQDPSAAPWAALLVSYTMMAAMTSPILTAVLTSRQTDIENNGAGWTLASTAGFTPGTLCRAKLAALAVILAPTVIVQTLLVIGLGRLAGIEVPLEPWGPWVGYTVGLFVIDVAFCALHIWLAAVAENQLISVGVGMLGAFIAVLTLLVQGWLARLLPWGYFAMIAPVTSIDSEVVYVTPEYGWIIGFLVVIATAFAAVTRRLDRIER